MTATVTIERPPALTELGQRTLRQLLRAWFDFERRLERVPIIQRLHAGTFTRDDYLQLLLHLRQQVVGSLDPPQASIAITPIFAR
jgi:hypothetical protein